MARPAAAQSPIVPVPNLPADSLTHRIKFAGVVAVPGVGAGELRARAREWVALTFQDAHYVTQLDDAARGVLIGRGYTTTRVDPTTKRLGNTAPLSFTFRLAFRDGRYRHQVFDLGSPLFPQSPQGPSLDSAPGVASRQAYETAAWQIGAAGTVSASPRQDLCQPDLAAFPRANNVAPRFGSRGPEASKAVHQTIARRPGSLRQPETAPVANW